MISNHFLVLLSLLAPEHLLLLAFIVLLMFGGKKIPELMKGIGNGVREFNEAKNNVTTHMQETMQPKDVTPEMSSAAEIEQLKRQVQQLQQNAQPQVVTVVEPQAGA